jgi:hypothetical protein
MTQQIINVGTVANDGTGEALRTAFNSVNDNFTEVYTAGPVGSNVVIANNTISINGTNGNLILQGNGIGNVVTNSSMRPQVDAVFDIGSPTFRYDTIHATYFVGNGSQLTGISGGAGNGTAIANGTSNVAVVGTNGNVTVGINGTGNVVTISSNRLNVNGNVTGGNITTSGLVSATGNIVGGNIVGGNIYIGNTILTRTLTVGTRTTPVTVPLATNNSFNVGQRTGGNVVVYTT